MIKIKLFEKESEKLNDGSIEYCINNIPRELEFDSDNYIKFYLEKDVFIANYFTIYCISNKICGISVYSFHSIPAFLNEYLGVTKSEFDNNLYFKYATKYINSTPPWYQPNYIKNNYIELDKEDVVQFFIELLNYIKKTIIERKKMVCGPIFKDYEINPKTINYEDFSSIKIVIDDEYGKREAIVTNSLIRPTGIACYRIIPSKNIAKSKQFNEEFFKHSENIYSRYKSIRDLLIKLCKTRDELNINIKFYIV